MIVTENSLPWLLTHMTSRRYKCKHTQSVKLTFFLSEISNMSNPSNIHLYTDIQKYIIKKTTSQSRDISGRMQGLMVCHDTAHSFLLLAERSSPRCSQGLSSRKTLILWHNTVAVVQQSGLGGGCFILYNVLFCFPTGSETLNKFEAVSEKKSFRFDYIHEISLHQ